VSRLPDGAHTHGHGGGAAGAAVLVVLAVIVIAAIAGPVIHAAELIAEVMLIAAASIAGLAVLVGAAFLAGRLHRRHARTQHGPIVLRSPQKLSAPDTAPRQLENHASGDRALHIHFHGLSAAEVAAILARQGLTSGPDSSERR
jgi:hypothetical protein